MLQRSGGSGNRDNGQGQRMHVTYWLLSRIEVLKSVMNVPLSFESCVYLRSESPGPGRFDDILRGDCGYGVQAGGDGAFRIKVNIGLSLKMVRYISKTSCGVLKRNKVTVT